MHANTEIRISIQLGSQPGKTLQLGAKGLLNVHTHTSNTGHNMCIQAFCKEILIATEPMTIKFS